MMMKTLYFFIFTFSMISVTSCSKDIPSSRNVPVTDKIGCVFYLGGFSGKSESKAVGMESDEGGIAAEKAVKSLQVYVFKADGSLAASRNVENSCSLKIDVNAGTGYYIYAICNEEDWTSSIASVTDLEAKETGILGTDDGATRFAMQGRLVGQTISSESKEFAIEVKRRAAKVVLRKVTNNLPEDLFIEGVYISNAVTNSCMFSDALPQTPVWVNQLGVFDGLSSFDWFGDKFERPVLLGKGEAYETAHTFYAAANPTAEDTHDTSAFTARYTRLVIRASIGGTTYYYPISFSNELPELTANDYFDVKNISIRHLGSDNPEIPVTVGQEVNVSVEVKVWNRSEQTMDL